MPEKTFPATLKRVRKQYHLSQAQLASKIYISLMTVRRYETGERFPNENILSRILFILHDKSIATAWASDYKVFYSDNSNEFISIENMAESLYQSKDATLRNIIINIGKTEPIEFIKPYLNITGFLLRLNDDGLKAVNNFAKLMTQVPDYQK